MRKLVLAVLLLSFLGSCQMEEEPKSLERNNRKNVSGERLTETPAPTPTKAAVPTKGIPTPKPTATGTPTPTPTPVPYMAMEEILLADEFSGKVQMADTLLQFPCRLKEIMAISGLVVEQSPYASMNGYDPLNDTYAAESSNSLQIIFPDGSEARITVENKEQIALPMKELYVTEIYSESPCIFFPKGIGVGAHCSVLKEWKEHDSLVSGSSVARYKYQETEYKMEYGTLDLGAEFAIDVNNSTYYIDAVEYVPAFYVTMEHMTDMVQNTYPKDLSYHVPIVLSESWKAGLIVYEGRRFALALEDYWMFENPKTTDALLAELGRELQYFNEEWQEWYYYTDKADANNEKIVVKEEDNLISVVNFWDYADFEGVETLTMEDKQVRPEHEKWKRFAEVAVLYDGYVDNWKLTLEPLDQGDIPEEVNKMFRVVVLEMAESVKEVEE